MTTEVSEEPYQVEVKGEGVVVKKTVDAEKARIVLNILLGGDGAGSRPGAPSRGTPSAAAAPQEHLSLREYLDAVKAKTKPEQMLAIANYLRTYEQQPDFDRDEVRNRFSDARETLPTNFPRDWHAAERHGWIAKASGKEGRYYVTKTGTDYLVGREGAQDLK